MFLVVSYLASDIARFIKNPIKIGVFVLLVFLAWKVRSKVNDKLDEKIKYKGYRSILIYKTYILVKI